MSFIKLTSSIHEDPENNRVLINPWEISSVCPRQGGGSIVVTRRGFTYKVNEVVEEVEDLARTLMSPKERQWNDDKSQDS